jgi:hypothetical protein
MACRVIATGPGGFVAIACGPRGRRLNCSVPGCLAAHVALCDFPLKGKGTCDLRLCEQHRVKVGPDEDRCPAHRRWEAARRG